MLAPAMLATITVVLVLLGVILYAIDLEGWAQLLWVFASGTAGGAVVLFIERRTEP